METKKCLIMCRTGMGSSMMLKIKVDKLIDKNGYPMDVTHERVQRLRRPSRTWTSSSPWRT